MRNSVSISLALSLLMTAQGGLISKAQAQRKPLEGHIEIIDMNNPEIIEVLDEQFIVRPDDNSVQQGIRLLALGMEAWNPSMQNTGTRQKLMGYVKEQGVLNGLVAPSMLLIERALKANKIEFAANLASMVRHISPKFYDQIPMNDKIKLLNFKDFRSVVLGTDLEVSGAMDTSLGGDFSAYSKRYSATELAVRQNSNFWSGLGSRSKGFFLSGSFVTKNSQDLILATVNSKNTPEGLQAAIASQCKVIASRQAKSFLNKNEFDMGAGDPKTGWTQNAKFSNIPVVTKSFDSSVFSQSPDGLPDLMSGTPSWMTQNSLVKNRCDELKHKRLNPKFDIEEELKRYIPEPEVDLGWVSSVDCVGLVENGFAASNGGGSPDTKEKRLHAERAKYSDGGGMPPPQNSCIGTCINSVREWSTTLGKTGAVVGFVIGGGPQGVVPGVFVGVVGGAVVGAIDCRASKQCGGDSVHNAQQLTALKKLIDDSRIREEKIREAEAKRQKAESEARVQKMNEDEAQREKNEHEQERQRQEQRKQKDELEKENRILDKEIVPDRSKARTGDELCNGSGCKVSNIVDYGTLEHQFKMAQKKEEERGERIREYYERKERVIDVDPMYYLSKLGNEEQKGDEEFRKCLERDSWIDYGPNVDLWKVSSEEQNRINAEKARQERDNRTTPVPQKPWDLYD